MTLTAEERRVLESLFDALPADIDDTLADLEATHDVTARQLAGTLERFGQLGTSMDDALEALPPVLGFAEQHGCLPWDVVDHVIQPAALFQIDIPKTLESVDALAETSPATVDEGSARSKSPARTPFIGTWPPGPPPRDLATGLSRFDGHPTTDTASRATRRVIDPGGGPVNRRFGSWMAEMNRRAAS